MLASAHDAYNRDREMTTEERVEMELRKLAQREKKQTRDLLSGSTKVSQQGPEPLTADALTAFDLQGTRKAEADIKKSDGEEIVPSMNYAVAELAKSLEESRKAVKKARKDNEELRAENDILRKVSEVNQEVQVQIRKFDDWVSPKAHKDLRTGWEEWADVAEKKISSLQTKLGKASEENESLLGKIKQSQAFVAKYEERISGFQDWTSPHERKVLDATIDMLENDLSETKAGMETCPTCTQRKMRAGRKSTRDYTKPILGRQKTVA